MKKKKSLNTAFREALKTAKANPETSPDVLKSAEEYETVSSSKKEDDRITEEKKARIVEEAMAKYEEEKRNVEFDLKLANEDLEKLKELKKKEREFKNREKTEEKYQAYMHNQFNPRVEIVTPIRMIDPVEI